MTLDPVWLVPQTGELPSNAALLAEPRIAKAVPLPVLRFVLHKTSDPYSNDKYRLVYKCSDCGWCCTPFVRPEPSTVSIHEGEMPPEAVRIQLFDHAQICNITRIG